MGSEFFINSQELEDKIRQLLPSQGGAGQGIDLSASTQIIPIIDLTESASGSNLREDLQKSYTHTNTTSFTLSNTSSTIINNTGFWRLMGNSTIISSTVSVTNFMVIDDSSSLKGIFQHVTSGTTTNGGPSSLSFDFIVKLEAGDFITGTSASANAFLNINTRQIASLDGVLINP